MFGTNLVVAITNGFQFPFLVIFTFVLPLLDVCSIRSTTAADVQALAAVLGTNLVVISPFKTFFLFIEKPITILITLGNGMPTNEIVDILREHVEVAGIVFCLDRTCLRFTRANSTAAFVIIEFIIRRKPGSQR